MKRLLCYFYFFALFSGVLSVAPTLAQDTKETPAASSDLSKRIDPGRPTPRLFVRDEYKEDEDGSDANILEFLYEFPLTNRLVLRTQVPVVSRNPVQGASDSGLGDITTRFGYRMATIDGNSYFVGLENKWDTASERTLGSGKNLISPVLFGYFRLPEYKALAFPLIQTFFTMGGVDSRRDVSYTVFKPTVLRKLENRYYMIFEPAIYVDHEVDDKTTGNIEVEFGRFVNAQTMLYARPGTTVWGDETAFSFKWNFEAGFRYFMK